MKLFSKIFLSVFICFLIAFFGLAFVIVREQIADAEQNIIDQYTTLGNFIAEEVKVGYLESRWPFENLSQLSAREDFLFWWVIDERGIIYLADKSAFMGSSASSYFSAIRSHPEGRVVLNRDENYGFYVKTVDASKVPWTFVLGFSLTSITQVRRDAEAATLFAFTIAALMIAGALYLIVRHLTEPIRMLVRGTEIVALGKLDYQLPVVTKDELGFLAGAFNNMTERLKGFYAALEGRVKERTQELEEAKGKLETVNNDLAIKLAEVERLNKTMVGRELKMIELKHKLGEYEKKLGMPPSGPTTGEN